MIQFLGTIFVLFLLLVLPVMFAARMVGAANTGFGSALLAVVLQVVMSALVRGLVSWEPLALLVTLLGGSAVYAWILGTTLVRGFLVSVITVVIIVVAVAGLAGMFTAVNVAG